AASRGEGREGERGGGANAAGRGARPQPLRCEDARPLLSASLDGEIGDEVEAALARHLAGCGPCARFRADLVEVDMLVRDAMAADDGDGHGSFDWGPVGRFLGEAPRVAPAA